MTAIEDLDPEYHRELMPIKGHFTDLGKAQKKKPRWVIEEVMTTGLTLVIGPPKDSFKTTLAMAFSLLIAKCEHHVLPASWIPRIQGPVLVFEAEADAGELREMVEDGMGVKVPSDERIMVADRPEDFRLDDPLAAEQMIAWAQERDVAAVLMDPLVNFHQLDEKDASAMVGVLRPLRNWAKDNDACFMLLHHTRKIEEGKAYTANDARGTSAIFGLVDNIIVITPGKEPFEIMISRKGKKGKAFEKMFQLSIWDRKGMKNTGESLRAVDKIILNAVMHGFVSAATIQQHVNLPAKTINERISALMHTRKLAQDKLHGIYIHKESGLTPEDLK